MPLRTRSLQPAILAATAIAAAHLVGGCSRTALDDDIALESVQDDAAGAEASPDSAQGAAQGGDPCANAPPIPCAGGGWRYCVAGNYSDCPKRCDVCVPGSQRVCFLAYCKFWGVQTCAADGRSFGYCGEMDAPPECEKIAEANHDSALLEQCCIDHGYCCRDQFDLDHDGNTNDMVGRCDGVAC